MLSEKSVLEYKEIFEKNYNIKISYEYAAEAAKNLLNLYKVVLELNGKQRERETNARAGVTPSLE